MKTTSNKASSKKTNKTVWMLCGIVVTAALLMPLGTMAEGAEYSLSEGQWEDAPSVESTNNAVSSSVVPSSIPEESVYSDGASSLSEEESDDNQEEAPVLEAEHQQAHPGVSLLSAGSITFNVNAVNDSNITSVVKYTLTDVAVGTVTNGYGSVSVSVPNELDMHYSLPTGWTSTPSGNSVCFIITNSTANGTADVVSTFLASNLYFTLKTTNIYPANDEHITVTIDEKQISTWIDENGRIHYYEFIASSGITWGTAYNAAQARTYNGLKGYLATITSQEEQDLIYNSIAKAGGWLGATRAVVPTGSGGYKKVTEDSLAPEVIAGYNITTVTGNEWYWANGPETGLVFYTKATWALGGQIPSGVYCYWLDNQPDAFGGAEAFMQFAYSGSHWNDLPFTYPSLIQGYYVEYGGYPGEEPYPVQTSHDAYIPAPVRVQYQSFLGVEMAPTVYLNDGKITSVYNALPLTTVPTGYSYMGLGNGSATATGWYTSKMQTVIHIYTANKYTVKFDSNYIGSANPASLMVTYAAAYGTLPTVTRTGYYFAGWNTENDGMGSTVTAATIVKVANEHTLYAQWTPMKYTLSFDSNSDGSISSPASRMVTYATAYGTLPTMSWEGHAFEGWNTKVNGTGSTITEEMLVQITGNHTLYAQWSVPIITTSTTANRSISPNSTASSGSSDGVTTPSASATLSFDQPNIEVRDDDTSVIVSSSVKGWSLVNLISSVVTVILAILSFLIILGRKPRAKLFWVPGSVMVALVSVLTLIFTSDFVTEMMMVNMFTPLMLILAVVQAVAFVLYMRKDNCY